MSTLSLLFPRTARSAGLPIQSWITLFRSRRQLGLLDPHLLADIGLTPDIAKAEVERPFWDAPAHWRN